MNLPPFPDIPTSPEERLRLTQYGELVRAMERERCAKVADEYATTGGWSGRYFDGYLDAAKAIASALRDGWNAGDDYRAAIRAETPSAAIDAARSTEWRGAMSEDPNQSGPRFYHGLNEISQDDPRIATLVADLKREGLWNKIDWMSLPRIDPVGVDAARMGGKGDGE